MWCRCDKITVLVGVIMLVELSTRLLVACGWFKGWLVGLWIKWKGWEMSERVRGLYPVKNADFVIAF